MSTNEPGPQESVGEQPSIAQSVCRDCDRHEELHTATRPADAKQQGVDAAIKHTRATGHNVDEALIDVPAATATRGPDVADTEVFGR